MSFISELQDAADEQAVLYFSDMDQGTSYFFALRDIFSPLEIDPHGNSRGYLIYDAISLKDYPENSIKKEAPLRVHFSKACFLRSLSKRVAYFQKKGMVINKDFVYDAHIKWVRVNKKRMEITSIVIFDKDGKTWKA